MIWVSQVKDSASFILSPKDVELSKNWDNCEDYCSGGNSVGGVVLVNEVEGLIGDFPVEVGSPVKGYSEGADGLKTTKPNLDLSPSCTPCDDLILAIPDQTEPRFSQFLTSLGKTMVGMVWIDQGVSTNSGIDRPWDGSSKGDGSDRSLLRLEGCNSSLLYVQGQEKIIICYPHP